MVMCFSCMIPIYIHAKLNLFSMVFLMKFLIRNNKKKGKIFHFCSTVRNTYQASYSGRNYLLLIYYGKIVKRGGQSSCCIQRCLVIRSSSSHHVPAYSKTTTEKT